tara:strand:+ start:1315 stop:1665 length:351 start_codon:yes stop_codon:yes gene_type:complete
MATIPINPMDQTVGVQDDFLSMFRPELIRPTKEGQYQRLARDAEGGMDIDEYLNFLRLMGLLSPEKRALPSPVKPRNKQNLLSIMMKMGQANEGNSFNAKPFHAGDYLKKEFGFNP